MEVSCTSGLIFQVSVAVVPYCLRSMTPGVSCATVQGSDGLGSVKPKQSLLPGGGVAPKKPWQNAWYCVKSVASRTKPFATSDENIARLGLYATVPFTSSRRPRTFN